MGWFLVPDAPPLVLFSRRFLVINGLTPSKSSGSKLVSGHAWCISEALSAGGVPRMC